MTEKHETAEAIFYRTIELDEESREDFLDQVCGGDRSLREEVDRLVENHLRAGDFLESPAADTAAFDLPLTEQAGTRIGPYKLLQKIGEGGMGVVYMAEQTDPVERRVALKIIKPGMDNRQVIARFEAERQALAMMDHPNIAKVLDAGTTASGRPYFVMELVKGISIAEYCDEHHLTPRQRLKLFVDVCNAIQHAHQKGIIHRDIKPTNVVVAEYDDQAVPKIIDFGVAKAIEQRLTQRTMFTHFGQVVGTVEYMSPEQAKFNQLDIDTRSDIYSLGVVLYELLAGEPPFDRERLRSKAFDEVLRIIREEEPPKPSLRLGSSESLPAVASKRHTEPAKLQSLLRGELDWIVMKAMEKDRTRRYETAHNLASDIQRYLDNEPVTACPPSKLYRLRKYVNRNQGATISAISIAAAILFGVIGIIVVLWHAQRIARRQAFEYGINLAYEDWNRGNRNEFENVMQQLDHVAGDQERRGFEWRFLWGKWQDLFSADVIETSATVLSMSYHPSGSHLAIHCEDGTVVVKECDTDRSVLLPNGMTAGHVRFSAKGNYLVVGRQVWRFPSFEQVVWPGSTRGQLSRLVVSPNERLLACVGSADTIEIRRLLTGELVDQCKGRRQWSQHAFSPDGQFLAYYGEHDGSPTIQLFNLRDKTLDSKPCKTGEEGRLVFGPAGDVLVAGGLHAAICWRVAEGRLQGPDWIFDEASIYSMAFSGDGILALGLADQTVRIWDLGKDNTSERQRLLHTSLVSAVAFSPRTQVLATATRDGFVELWNPRIWRGADAVRVSTHFSPPLATSSNGDVATAEIRDTQYVFKLWNPKSGAKRDFWVDKSARIIGAAFSPDGKLIASASDNGTIRLRNVETGELLLERKKAHVDTATCVAFSPNGKTLVSGGSRSDLLFWDLPLWRKNADAYEPQKRKGPKLVASLAFSRKNHLACGGGLTWNQSGEVMVWDFNSGSPQQIGPTRHYPETVRCVAYSPDGTRMALTYKFSAGIVHVLDATTCEMVFELRGHANKVTTLVFTPDGSRLITGSDDGTIRFWDLDYDGKPIGTLRIGVAVRNLAMLSDGNRLLTLTRDGWLRLWRAAP